MKPAATAPTPQTVQHNAGSNDTVVTDAYTGRYARLLRNGYSEQYDVLEQLAALG